MPINQRSSHVQVTTWSTFDRKESSTDIPAPQYSCLFFCRKAGGRNILRQEYEDLSMTALPQLPTSIVIFLSGQAEIGL
jgi:hypothetical protein